MEGKMLVIKRAIIKTESA